MMKKSVKKNFFICLLFIPAITITEKALIITHAYNRPEFIPIQNKTFRKFLQSDYEYVVFNDAKTDEMEVQIRTACEQSGVKCYRIPQEIHERPYMPREKGDPLHRPNVRHANNIQYSLDHLGFDHDGIVFIIDSDMFLVRPFNLEQFMMDKDVAGVIKRPFKYEKDPRNLDFIWPAFCILHMDRLPQKHSLNFNCGFIEGNIHTDSGGYTYYYLKNHPELAVYNVDSLYSFQIYLGSIDFNLPIREDLSDDQRFSLYTRCGFNKSEIDFLMKKPHTFEYFLDKCFFHYHGASNYHGSSQEFHEYKTRIFMEYIEDIMSK